MLKALIVDDEEPAITELKYRLSETGWPVQVTSALTTREALRLLRQREFDVVFLDIQMPEMNGIELLQQSRPPVVVFVTAYEEYAIQAFELRAVDYLLKPVRVERLLETLERVRTLRFPAPRAEPPRVPPLDRLPVEQAGRTRLIDLAEIRFAEANDEVVLVKTYDQSYAVRYTLSELEGRLPNPPFLRVHRSYIANLKRVVEIRPYFNGSYLLKLDDKQQSEIAVSRSHVRSLRSLLGL
ncbi:MAG: LytTR family DNA-binding domain-containing protein [Chloroflexi bacterium]|nr:LytTR family DNA-binding domain-containing protein [Chloroflexota bacterium]